MSSDKSSSSFLAALRKILGLVGRGSLAALVVFLIRTFVKRWRLVNKHYIGLRPKALQAASLHPFGDIPQFFKLIKTGKFYDVLHTKWFSGENMDNFLVLGTWMDPGPWFYSRDPVVVKTILSDNFDVWCKGDEFQACFHQMLGNGIFNLNHGPLKPDEHTMWLFQRKTASKLFTANKFRGFMEDVFVRHSNHVVKFLSSKGKDGTFDAKDLWQSFTFNSAGEVGFGLDFTDEEFAQDGAQFAKSFEAANYCSTSRYNELHPGWTTFLGPMLYKEESEMPKHIEFIDRMMEKVKNIRMAEDPSTERWDIFSYFLKESRKQGPEAEFKVDSKLLRDVSMSILIASRDTTAGLLLFFFRMLAQPEIAHVKERLLKEVDEFNIAAGGSLYDTVDNCRYLHATILEDCFSKAYDSNPLTTKCVPALRLFPPVPIDVKAAMCDTFLPGIGNVPKGTLLLYSMHSMGRSPKLWGDDASKIKPERWFTKELDKRGLPILKKVSPYLFPVFNAGPRICLGQSMAIFEAKVVILHVLQKFDLMLADPNDAKNVKYLMTATLTWDGPLNMKATPRK